MSLCIAETSSHPVALDTPVNSDTPDAPVTPPKRSGGPRTVEGKDVSRRNALKRGLRSRVVFPEDVAELVEKRTLDFFAEFSPRSTYEEILVRDMAVSSIRFERCGSLSFADQVRVADRADLCWEQDRRQLVENFASRISKDPQRVARRLRNTRQGTDFLVEHWEILAAIVIETGRWDDDQRQIAFDLLGVSRELRNVTIKVPGGDETAKLIALAESEIADLREQQIATLDDLNDAEQAMVMAGMPLEEDAASARLRKDEARARNDFARAHNALLRHRAGQTNTEIRRELLSGSDQPPNSNPNPNPIATPSQVTREVPAVAVKQEAVAVVVADVVKLVEESTGAASTPVEKGLSRRGRKDRERRIRAASRREDRTR